MLWSGYNFCMGYKRITALLCALLLLQDLQSPPLEEATSSTSKEPQQVRTSVLSLMCVCGGGGGGVLSCVSVCLPSMHVHVHAWFHMCIPKYTYVVVHQ